MDFDRLSRDLETGSPVEPRELYEQLPSKAAGYGYLRDVQAQILTKWHEEKRAARDIVIKVNTGGGKTIDGLVILQSYLNDGAGPALYVAPSNYLVTQVVAEAGKLGIAVTTDPDSLAYRAAEKIGVVTAARVFNGRSIFSDARPPGTRVPIGAVVVDDAHAAVDTIRQQLSLAIPRSSNTFDDLLQLFKTDIASQAPEVLLDIQDNRGSGIARVPFWSIRSSIDDMRAALRSYVPANEKDFSHEATRDVLHLCRVVFTRSAVTITPPVPPIGRISSFTSAAHRVFLTATLADDSVLVSHFGADPALVSQPVQPISAGDIGERMILAPQEINSTITADAIRAEVVKLSASVNVLVIVPSDRAMEQWPTATRANADNLQTVVGQMRDDPKFGLVVVANKYDGIDLPQDACRVLVLDGLPEAYSGDERLESLMNSSFARVDDRQIQRIEQGMGRGVRSNEDHCVVFLIGRRLAQLTVDPRSLERFSPATRAQLKASRAIARQMENTPLSRVMETVQQALDRDPGWVRYAKSGLRGIAPEPARISTPAVAERRAFDRVLLGDTSGGVKLLREAAASCDDPKRKGQLLEQAGAYVDPVDPVQAQQLLALAREDNIYVLRPLSGIVFTPLNYAGSQADIVAARLTGMYGTPASMRVAVENMLDALVFDPLRTDEFEEAMYELGLFLGFNSQRPERQLNPGLPDNLWALEPGRFWVIEAKTGATSEFIAKRDVGQLSQGQTWFGNHYSPTDVATPVMVHHSRKLFKDASAIPGMRIIDERVLGELVASVRAYSEGLVPTGWSDIAVVDRLLEGHGLRPTQLEARLRTSTGGAI
ncbi:helicase C-terminal domain-containing protein [Microbacterium sp. 16-032]|uniref:helicase C-terminal domain-containing protein n=1 Tax=Microbacterium sp. 16-032 TaxID=3239808 RepID=UPI0034E19834